MLICTSRPLAWRGTTNFFIYLFKLLLIRISNIEDIYTCLYNKMPHYIHYREVPDSDAVWCLYNRSGFSQYQSPKKYSEDTIYIHSADWIKPVSYWKTLNPSIIGYSWNDLRIYGIWLHQYLVFDWSKGNEWELSTIPLKINHLNSEMLNVLPYTPFNTGATDFHLKNVVPKIEWIWLEQYF